VVDDNLQQSGVLDMLDAAFSGKNSAEALVQFSNRRSEGRLLEGRL
jgi:hypothetical protein